MLDVKYGQLELMRKVVKAAKELEKDTHRKQADEKTANWVLKQARDADLTLDEDLKHEIQEKLSGKKRTHKQKGGEDEDDLL